MPVYESLPSTAPKKAKEKENHGRPGCLATLLVLLVGVVLLLCELWIPGAIVIALWAFVVLPIATAGMPEETSKGWRRSVSEDDPKDPRTIRTLRLLGLSQKEKKALTEMVRELERWNKEAVEIGDYNAYKNSKVWIMFLQAILRGETPLPETPLPSNVPAWAAYVTKHSAIHQTLGSAEPTQPSSILSLW
jgi:hypothetical protein